MDGRLSPCVGITIHLNARKAIFCLFKSLDLTVSCGRISFYGEKVPISHVVTLYLPDYDRFDQLLEQLKEGLHS